MERCIKNCVSVVIMLFIATYNVFGYGEAKINQIWLETDTQKNGESGIKIHVDFNAIGVKDNKIRVQAYFYDSNKNKMMGGIVGYRTKNGQVSVTKDKVSTYNNSHWKDLVMFIPYSALRLSTERKKYYVKVVIRDKTQEIKLSKNESYFSFVDKSPSRRKDRDYSGNSGTQSNNSYVKTWKEPTVNGFVIVNEYRDGTKLRARYRPCLNCKGTVKCNICYGSGRCSLCYGEGSYLEGRSCASCRGTGICQMCNGLGKCRCSTTKYPGYVIGSISTISPDGSISRERFDYTDGGSSTIDTSPSKSSCSYCHGTGVDPSISSGGSLTSWIAYTNMSGAICPYCNSVTSHQHIRCSHCNVPNR